MDDECDSNADCDLLNLCLAGACTHKELFPIAGADVFLGFVIFVFTGIASAAGVTGASILIPIAITIGNFGTHVAIALISAASFGGVVVAVLVRIQLRHLVVDKPRIDYDVAMHLCMPMMLGAVAGVMLNIVLPEWAILVLLLLVLLNSTYNTFSRAVYLQKLSPVEEPMLARVKENISVELEAIYTEEARLIPYRPLVWICLMLLVVTVSVFVRGGKAIHSVLGFIQCSRGYLTSTFLFVLICIGFMWRTSSLLIAKTAYYNSIGYQYIKGDFHWNPKQCLSVISGGIVTGLISGLFGIAGGVAVIPLLLKLNMRPEVANATCSFVTFFTNFTTFLQYAVSESIPYQYGLAYCIVSIFGSFIGVFLLEKVVRKVQSVTVYLLGFIMIIATVLVPIYEVSHAISQVKRGTFHPGLHEFC